MKTFFMVYAEGKETPAVKHETLEEAQQEAMRLCKKLGVKCYVLGELVEYEADKPIEVKQHKPCKCYWYKITGDKEKDDALKSKLIDLMPDTQYCYQPTESAFEAGKIAYNNGNRIDILVDGDRTFSQIVKMFGIKLRIKEE